MTTIKGSVGRLRDAFSPFSTKRGSRKDDLNVQTRKQVGHKNTHAHSLTTIIRQVDMQCGDCKRTKNIVLKQTILHHIPSFLVLIQAVTLSCHGEGTITEVDCNWLFLLWLDRTQGIRNANGTSFPALGISQSLSHSVPAN